MHNVLNKIRLKFPSIITIFFLSLAIFMASCENEAPGKTEDLPLAFLPDSLSILEGNTNKEVLIDVKITFPFADTIKIIVKTEDGTAKAGLDYKEINSTPLVFEPGALRKVLAVTVYGDSEFEPDENFSVILVGADNAEIEQGTIVITLLNDDIDNTFRLPTSGSTSPLTYPNMKLIWSDEFDRTTLGTQYYTFETGGNGWGNNELQFYRAENTFISEGNLVIEARRENFSGRAFTSSRIITKGKIDFKYGRVDIRASLPFGQGIWPAQWLLGSNISQVGWPRCGEIDIMEMIGGNGREKTVHGTAHWQGVSAKADFGGSYTLAQGTFHDKYHVFSIIWDENSIKWLVNDIQYHQMSITPAELSEFRESFFFIFNIAVGGNWPGSPDQSTIFPQRMIIDYVRVFQPE